MPDGFTPRFVDLARNYPGASFEIQLVDRQQWLTSCEEEALACDVNLAILGSELVQFRDALPLGDGRFRLSGLVRGVAGTAAVEHDAGEPFVLARPEALRMVDLPPWASGRRVTVRAQTQHGGAASAEAVVQAPTLAPLRGTGVTVDGEQVVGRRQPAIALPTGGNLVDSDARAALSAVVSAMRSHGLIES